MTFVDEITVFARAGDGGHGSAALHSEPYKPLGGPDGGDGGRGGDVVFQAAGRVRDLSGLADRPHVRAPRGGRGASKRRTGADGEDLVVQVPDGSMVFDHERLLADLVGEGARAVVARGGRGGRGNASLASPRNRVPRAAEAGEPGEDKRVRVELRIVADVGLVGLPNAGKSTLLSVLTAARPRIADYPFTTLDPNLGVAEGEGRFVIADIPGLIEGASQGRGLGHKFLRHVTRCRVLVLVVDLSGTDPPSDLTALRAELDTYDPALSGKPSIVVGAKADLVEDAMERVRVLGDDAVAVSALTGIGMADVSARLRAVVAEAPDEERRPYVVLRPGRPRFEVRREGERYRVVGRGVERLVAETDLDDPREVARLQRRLVREGVERRLTAEGARRGDEVVIGSRTFEFIPEEADDD
jgi:GTP-binding protein